MMSAFLAFRLLVVLLEGHNEHGVGVVAELHEVRHPPGDGAVLPGGDGGFVDGAIPGHERVIGAVQLPTSLVPLPRWPIFVLGQQNASGLVAYLDQGSQAPAHHGAVRGQGPVAVGDGNAMAVLDLPDGLVVCDEETAFGDMAF
jgi:hypothetical protein